MDLNQEIYAMIFLTLLKGLEEDQLHALISHFGSAHTAMELGPDKWRDVLSESYLLGTMKEFYEETKFKTDEELKLALEEKVNFFLCHVGPYPEILRQIRTPPSILYVKGSLAINEDRAIAIIGSRRPTYYGEKMARRLAGELAAAGAITVSGLARGVDSHVHEATLEAKGTTWAVVGCGLSNCYPPENNELSQKIASGGAVISEFSMATPPYPGNFPRRNRIIAGLTKGTVVIEGTARSGSLITARIAAEEGREVFALPGPVTSLLSEAPHLLIQSGAKLVHRAADILEEFPKLNNLRTADQIPDPTQSAGISDLQKLILRQIVEAPLSKEILAERLEKSPSELAPLLLDLELNGLIRTIAGGRIALT